MSESQLVYSVMQELGKHGAVFRTNAGRFYTRSGQAISGLPKGFTDVLFIGPDGIACFIECKLKSNKPSPEQVEFIERMQSLGARAGIAYDVDDAIIICDIHHR